MADESPLAAASLELAAPIDRARAFFFDLDAQVRLQPYHGVELTWAPQHPPEARRLRQRARVLGRTHDEEFVIEPGDGGAWVRRYVDGPNAGTRFVATFRPVGETKTYTRAEAFVPPSGFSSGIGKVSKIGMQKILEKLLDEHRPHVEGAPAPPPPIDPESLRTLSQKLHSLADAARGEAIQTLLEIACLTAIADGQADPAERSALHRVFVELCGLSLGDAAMDEMIASASEVVADDGIELRCQLAGQALIAHGLGDDGLDIAAAVALSSHGIDRHELATMERLAAAAGLNGEAVGRAIERVGKR
jgi:hypothetical protein